MSSSAFLLMSSMTLGIDQKEGLSSPWSGFSFPQGCSVAVSAAAAEQVLFTKMLLSFALLQLFLLGHCQLTSGQSLQVLNGPQNSWARLTFANGAEGLARCGRSSP